jgi:ketosteroid isomerase-like protein
MPVLGRFAALILLVLPMTDISQALPTDESRAMAMTQSACNALRSGDVAAIRRLLTPDFVLVGSDAQVQSRDDLIGEVLRGNPRYQVFRNHSMTARIYADAAVVQGITTLEGSAEGKRFALDVRFTDTLIRHEGEWRMVASHVSRIPAAP